MFHTLYIVQRDTRICPYLGFFAILYPLTLSQLWDSSVKTPVIYFFIPPSSASAAVSAISLVPTRSIPCLFPPPHTRPPPPASSPLPLTGTELVASQYTARLYSALAKCCFPMPQTPPPLLPPPSRCFTIFRPTTSLESAPSEAAPPGLGKTPGPCPCGG